MHDPTATDATPPRPDGSGDPSSTTDDTDPLTPPSLSLEEIPLPLEEPMPARIGGYRVMRVLGRGGMGTVYEAEQAATRRLVALKVIHPHLATPRSRRRFAKEIRALAKFEHSGIARIHDAGATIDEPGTPRLYCAMELIRGLRVDEYVARERLGPRRIAELIARVCDAVHHAHLKGVIHCDLKPANIMVEPDGSPKVLDFGIARLLDEDPGMGTQSEATAHPSILGTIAYASPEQTAGERSSLDALTDVYGLGAVLYATVAGRPPHDVSSCSLAQAIERTRARPPARLHVIAPRCPSDLATIAAMAMAPSPSRRYTSAAAMAEDLRRFAAGRPIAARPTAWHEALGMWMRRNRALSAALGLAALVLAGLLTSVFVGAARVNREAKRVRAERDAHQESRSALQGSSLPLSGRFRISNNFLAHLDENEAVDAPGRVMRAFAEFEDGRSIAGRSKGRLLLLNAEGDVVRELDRPCLVPRWARPRFDGSRRFEALTLGPSKVMTNCAVIGDVNGDGDRDLLRGIRLCNDSIHMAAIDCADVTAVVNAQGTGSQIWSSGDVQDLRIDTSRGLLWCVAYAEDLAMYVPELVAWDSARCPGGSVPPTLLLGIPLDRLDGVIPPLRGDAEHPPIRPRFAWTTRPPHVVRTTLSSGDPTSAPTDRASRRTWIYLQAFVPAPAEENRGLGVLYVAFSDRVRELPLFATVALDDRGQPVGRFQIVSSREPTLDAEAAAFVSQFDPREEILALDLGRVADASETAERLVAESALLDGVEASTPTDDEETRRCLLAMQTSWTWLAGSGSEVPDAAALLRRLGEASQSEPSAHRRCQQLRRAIELHAARTAAHQDGPCIHDRYLRSALALAEASAQDWEGCRRDAQQAFELRTRGQEDHYDVVSACLVAIASVRLGLPAEAHSALAVAEFIARKPMKQDGSAYWKAPILLDRARTLVR